MNADLQQHVRTTIALIHEWARSVKETLSGVSQESRATASPCSPGSRRIQIGIELFLASYLFS